MPKVFLVEDDPHICELFRLFFSDLDDFEVIVANEPTACPLYGNDACHCPQDTSCGDFLIIDNHLPQMTGLEFIQLQIKKGCKGSVRNKAVISAFFTPAELEKATALGCRVFRKPFLFRDISAWVNGTPG